MDAASYAVHRDQSMRDNANKILQMMLAAKQFMSGRDFDERQFAYKQEQDKTENAYRSQSQAREDEKFEKSLAQQDRQFGLQERGMKIKENPVTKEMQNYNALVEQGIDPETAKRVSFKYKPDKSTGQIKDEAKAYWQGRVEAAVDQNKPQLVRTQTGPRHRPLP